eukprot:2247675-Alexandrium_andersonii.AAC.1
MFVDVLRLASKQRNDPLHRLKAKALTKVVPAVTPSPEGREGEQGEPLLRYQSTLQGSGMLSP